MSKAQWLLLAVTLAGTSCASRPSDEECLSLLDRYTDKLLRESNPKLPEAELLRLRSEARSRALDDPAVGACRGKITRAGYDCAMRAPSVDAMELCLVR